MPPVPVLQSLQAPAPASSSTSSDKFSDFDSADNQAFLVDIELNIPAASTLPSSALTSSAASTLPSSALTSSALTSSALTSSAASTAGFSHSVRIILI